MMPAPDHVEELALIAMSRLQRETLDRWLGLVAVEGETKIADDIRQAIAKQDARLERQQFAPPAARMNRSL
jgi:hypothetical protein